MSKATYAHFARCTYILQELIMSAQGTENDLIT